MTTGTDTLSGVLIAESLRDGAEVTGIPLRVDRVARVAMPDAGPGQPSSWTLLYFTAAAADAGPLAESLAAALSPAGGWYVDYRTAAETFVVFPGRLFRYSRGDTAGRLAAQRHGRAIGVPEPQLDWGV